MNHTSATEIGRLSPPATDVDTMSGLAEVAFWKGAMEFLGNCRLVRVTKLILSSMMTFALVAAAQSGAPAPQQPAATSSPSKAPIPSVKTGDVQSAVVLKTNTRMVLVDVIASDGKGHFNLDLHPEDFVVLEDGKPQRIRSFSLQKPGQPEDAKAAGSKVPATVFTNVPAYEGTKTLSVILLDGLNTRMVNQDFARKQMIKFLEKMPADQPIAVYTLASKLRLVQDFTSDPAVLQRAIKSMQSEANILNNRASASEGELLLGNLDGIGMSVDPLVREDLARFEADTVSFQTEIRVQYFNESLRALARKLSGYPGRKNLIWLSEGFPLTVEADTSIGGTSVFAPTRNMNVEVAKTVNALLDAQVAIYPVDLRGLMGAMLADSSSNAFDQLSRSESGPAMVRRMTSQTQVNSINDPHDAMNDLADRTGGKALYNRNDVDTAIQTSIEDGSTYYLIGYYPDNKDWNGKFRKIQVKLNAGGSKLRHRMGYFAVDTSAYAAVDPKIRSRNFARAMAIELPVSTNILFKADVRPPAPGTKEDVKITYNVDARMLVFQPTADGMETVEVECAVQAYSEKGVPVNSNIDSMIANLKPTAHDGILQRGFPCEQSLQLASGKYLLRLGVRDTRTGLVGTANAAVTVP